MQIMVSVIIIFLNEERFLEEAIKSVMEQSYADWELILVDDGSSDKSSLIAQSIAYKHDKVFYKTHLSNSNRGMSASRNLGISAAKGKYICFLDGDDVWLPNKLQEQVAIMKSHPTVGMLYGRTLLWRSWDQESSAADSDAPLGSGQNRLWICPQLLPRLLNLKHQTPTTCNAMFTRRCLDEVDGFDDSFRDLYEDQVVFLKVLATQNTYLSSALWAKYRQRASSTFNSSVNSDKDRQMRKRLLHSFTKYIKRKEIHLNPKCKLTLFKAKLRCQNQLNWNIYLYLQTYMPKLFRIVLRPAKLCRKLLE